MQIDDFILGDTLGEGTFGKVKIATHCQTGEKVAIKILSKKKIKENEDEERISREINILKKLMHPNIAQLYSVIETNHHLYLIMEYCESGELFHHIVLNQRLSEIESCKLFFQLISGVEYLHKNGVVHRDLKPENLLLHKSKLKIVDFGLSNTYKPGEKLKTACGSPSYAAPEMILGNLYDGLFVDIWSCGIILYAMVCGCLPFDDKNGDVLFQKIVNGKFVLPRYLSTPLQDLLVKILKTDPKKRIDMKGIKNHYWLGLVNHIKSPGLLINSGIEIPIDMKIIEEISEMKFNKEEVIDYIRKNRHNRLTTCYYLIVKKRINDKIETISDFGGKLFLDYLNNFNSKLETKKISSSLEDGKHQKLSSGKSNERNESNNKKESSKTNNVEVEVKGRSHSAVDSSDLKNDSNTGFNKNRSNDNTNTQAKADTNFNNIYIINELIIESNSKSDITHNHMDPRDEIVDKTNNNYNNSSNTEPVYTDINANNNISELTKFTEYNYNVITTNNNQSTFPNINNTITNTISNTLANSSNINNNNKVPISSSNESNIKNNASNKPLIYNKKSFKDKLNLSNTFISLNNSKILDVKEYLENKEENIEKRTKHSNISKSSTEIINENKNRNSDVIKPYLKHNTSTTNNNKAKKEITNLNKKNITKKEKDLSIDNSIGMTSVTINTANEINDDIVKTKRPSNIPLRQLNINEVDYNVINDTNNEYNEHSNKQYNDVYDIVLNQEIKDKSYSSRLKLLLQQKDYLNTNNTNNNNTNNKKTNNKASTNNKNIITNSKAEQPSSRQVNHVRVHSAIDNINKNNSKNKNDTVSTEVVLNTVNNPKSASVIKDNENAAPAKSTPYTKISNILLNNKNLQINNKIKHIDNRNIEYKRISRLNISNANKADTMVINTLSNSNVTNSAHINSVILKSTINVAVKELNTPQNNVKTNQENAINTNNFSLIKNFNKFLTQDNSNEVFKVNSNNNLNYAINKDKNSINVKANSPYSITNNNKSNLKDNNIIINNTINKGKLAFINSNTNSNNMNSNNFHNNLWNNIFNNNNNNLIYSKNIKNKNSSMNVSNQTQIHTQQTNNNYKHRSSSMKPIAVNTNTHAQLTTNSNYLIVKKEETKSKSKQKQKREESTSIDKPLNSNIANTNINNKKSLFNTSTINIKKEFLFSKSLEKKNLKLKSPIAYFNSNSNVNNPSSSTSNTNFSNKYSNNTNIKVFNKFKFNNTANNNIHFNNYYNNINNSINKSQPATKREKMFLNQKLRMKGFQPTLTHNNNSNNSQNNNNYKLVRPSQPTQTRSNHKGYKIKEPNNFNNNFSNNNNANNNNISYSITFNNRKKNYNRVSYNNTSSNDYSFKPISSSVGPTDHTTSNNLNEIGGNYSNTNTNTSMFMYNNNTINNFSYSNKSKNNNNINTNSNLMSTINNNTNSNVVTTNNNINNSIGSATNEKIEYLTKESSTQRNNKVETKTSKTKVREDYLGFNDYNSLNKSENKDNSNKNSLMLQYIKSIGIENNKYNINSLINKTSNNTNLQEKLGSFSNDSKINQTTSNSNNNIAVKNYKQQNSFNKKSSSKNKNDYKQIITNTNARSESRESNKLKIKYHNKFINYSNISQSKNNKSKNTSKNYNNTEKNNDILASKYSIKNKALFNQNVNVTNYLNTSNNRTNSNSNNNSSNKNRNINLINHCNINNINDLLNTNNKLKHKNIHTSSKDASNNSNTNNINTITYKKKSQSLMNMVDIQNSNSIIKARNTNTHKDASEFQQIIEQLNKETNQLVFKNTNINTNTNDNKSNNEEIRNYNSNNINLNMLFSRFKSYIKEQTETTNESFDLSSEINVNVLVLLSNLKKILKEEKVGYTRLNNEWRFFCNFKTSVNFEIEFNVSNSSKVSKENYRVSWIKFKLIEGEKDDFMTITRIIFERLFN